MTWRAGEVSAMRTAQGDHMNDTCILLTYDDSTVDAYGRPVPSYTVGSAISCGVDLGDGGEVLDETRVAVAEGVVRLPATTTVDPEDRIRVSHIGGIALATALTFEIVGLPESGPTAALYNVRTVTEDTAA